MTRLDVKNYLHKIYDVKAMDVRTTIVSGHTHIRNQDNELYKENDYKLAFVKLVS
jgi:ribosomal protein L23